MMNDVQEKQLELLVELDRICRENNISYSLFGYTAWQAYVKHELTEGVQHAPEVAMLPAAARAFVKAVEGSLPSDRYIEYIGNNPRFDRLDIRYGNANTLDFETNYAYLYRNHGIHVRIHLLTYRRKRSIDKVAYKALATDAEFDSQHHPFDAPHLAVHAARKALDRLGGQGGGGKMRFELLLGDGTGVDKSRVLYKPYGRKTATYPSFWFSDTIPAKLEGHDFAVPSTFDLYFTRLYGADWKNAVPNVASLNPETRIQDADLPFHEWLSQPGVQEHIASFSKKKSSLAVWQSKTRQLAAKNVTYWNIVQRSGMRFKLWEEYMPQKREILELVDAGRYEEAKARLAHYIKQLNVYHRRKLGLCFDADLFRAVQRCLVHDGRFVYAEELRALVPKKHWKPIDIDVREYWKMEPKVFSEATESDLEEIKEFASRDISKGVYLYIDVFKYGLSNPNMKLWVLRSANTNCICSVVMKYGNTMSIIANDSVVDFGFFADLVNGHRPTMVSGELELIKKVIPLLDIDYEVEEGWVYDITNYRLIESNVGIEPAYESDMREAAELICGEWPYYNLDDLERQLIARLKDGMARNFMVRKDGKMIAHICTYAEDQGIGVTAGLVVDEDHRDVPYGTFLESHLVDSMRKSGLQAYTFVTHKKRTKLFDAMGGIEKGRYGKLTIDA